MYRLLVNIQGARAHRAPGQSNRQRAALKREKPAGEPETERWKSPPLFLCWEASDQRTSIETPLLSEWRFLHQP
jgi:hypothetical protein